MFLDVFSTVLPRIDLPVTEESHKFPYFDLFEASFQRRFGSDGSWTYQMHPKTGRSHGKYLSMWSGVPTISRDGVPLRSIDNSPFARYVDSFGEWTVRFKPTRKLLF